MVEQERVGEIEQGDRKGVSFAKEVGFSVKVREILERQPLNPFRKLEFDVVKTVRSDEAGK